MVTQIEVRRPSVESGMRLPGKGFGVCDKKIVQFCVHLGEPAVVVPALHFAPDGGVVFLLNAGDHFAESGWYHTLAFLLVIFYHTRFVIAVCFFARFIPFSLPPNVPEYHCRPTSAHPPENFP